MKNEKIERIAVLGILTAVVIVLQLLGSFIRFGPFSISLTLIPIVVGAALYGKWAGTWLGFIFSVTVLISGDAAVFLGFNLFGTLLTVLIKGSLAGFCAGLVYKLYKKRNHLMATFLAAIICPIVNTGIFLIGCRLFFMPLITNWAIEGGFENVGLYMIVGLVGINFIFELIVNIILSPTVLTLIKMGKKELK